MKNPVKPTMPNNSEGQFFRAEDGSNIFIYDYIPPVQDYKSTIYLISGITGINHNNEEDIISRSLKTHTSQQIQRILLKTFIY